MKLQLALDDITLDGAISLCERVSDYVDIFEIGTPLLMEYGMEAVRAIRRSFPEKEILCDAKIMDGGRLEAGSAFSAGADYVTVLALTDDTTISAVVETANEHGKQAVADLMCVQDLAACVRRLERLGVHMAAVHVGVDQQKAGRTPLLDLRKIKEADCGIEVAVAGGINSDTIREYASLRPDVIVVGGGIVSAAKPEAEAEICRKRLVSE